MKTSLPKGKVGEGKSYGVVQKGVPIPFFDNKNKMFYLTIYYEKESLKVINFLFEEKKKDLKKLFDFIRESIILSEVYPRCISLDLNILRSTKNILKNIFFSMELE